MTVTSVRRRNKQGYREQFKNTQMSKLREKEYRPLSLAADGTTGLLSAVSLR